MLNPKAAIFVYLMPPSSDRWDNQFLCFETLLKQKDCEVIVGDVEQEGLEEFCNERNLKRVFGFETHKEYDTLPLVKNLLGKFLSQVSDSVEYIMFCASDYYYLTDNLVELVTSVESVLKLDFTLIMARGFVVPEDADFATGCLLTRHMNRPGIGTFICRRKELVKLINDVPETLVCYEWGVERYLAKWAYESKMPIVDLTFEFRALHRKHSSEGKMRCASMDIEQRKKLYDAQLAFSDNMYLHEWLNKYECVCINSSNGLNLILYNVKKGK